MSLVLLADTTPGRESLKRILSGHECVGVGKLNEAMKCLQERVFDLIIIGIEFDDSQMFQLVREVKLSPNNGQKPIICYCSRETKTPRLMQESLEFTTRALGAWMYLDEHAYNVYKDPDEELRRVIDRCLTGQMRKDIHQQRMHIQKQRTELNELRGLLEAQEWSFELETYLAALRDDLEQLLHEVTRLQELASNERAKIETSRDLKDRVSEFVTVSENGMTQAETSQSSDESRQSIAENELAAKEASKGKDGKRTGPDQSQEKN